MTSLRREFPKASGVARKHGTPPLRDVANMFKEGYFKAITAAKNKH